MSFQSIFEGRVGEVMTESERERLPNLYSRQNRRPYHHVDGDAGLDFRATLTSRRCSSEPN